MASVSDFPARGKIIAMQDRAVVFAPSETNYELRLEAEGSLDGARVGVIVRINQFDAHQAEALAGWPQRGRYGPVEHRWAADTQAYEVLILDTDENGQPVSDNFRQAQLRQLIPEVLAALRHGGEEVIL